MKPKLPVILTIVIALWLPLAVVCLSLFGCEAGTTGLLRPMSASAYTTTTNVVTVAAEGTTQVAGPAIAGPIQALAAAILALLAAWQGITHSNLTKLTTKVNGGKPAP